MSNYSYQSDIHLKKKYRYHQKIQKKLQSSSKPENRPVAHQDEIFLSNLEESNEPISLNNYNQEKERLYQTEQQLEQFMVATDSFVYKAGLFPHYALKFISENCQKFIGFQSSEIINNKDFWLSRIHPEDLDILKQEILKPELRENRKIEYRFLTKDSKYRWLREQAKIIFDSAGNPLEIFGICQEITEFKQLEEKSILLINKEKQLTEMRHQIITMTSHEFRTPLCTILSSADLLELYIERGRIDKQKEHIERIQISALRISNLLSDILAAGQGIAGLLPFHPAPLNIEEICQKSIQEIVKHFVLPTNKIQFINRVNKSENIYLDEKLLEQILFNILSNAVKYSPLESPLFFEVTDSKTDPIQENNTVSRGTQNPCPSSKLSSIVTFKIKDLGIGIPVIDQSMIFELFYRGSNIANQGGTGLGLPIVKQATEAHQGQIVVESQEGIGTTVTITLPVFSNPTT